MDNVEYYLPCVYGAYLHENEWSVIGWNHEFEAWDVVPCYYLGPLIGGVIVIDEDEWEMTIPSSQAWSDYDEFSNDQYNEEDEYTTFSVCHLQEESTAQAVAGGYQKVHSNVNMVKVFKVIRDNKNRLILNLKDKGE